MGVRVGAVWRCRVRGQDGFGHVGVAAEAFGQGIPLGVERDVGQSVGYVDLGELGSRVPPRGSSQRGSECGLFWVGDLGLGEFVAEFLRECMSLGVRRRLFCVAGCPSD